MKKIGLIGGMSWESSLVYYKLINEKVKKILGGHHSAEIIMYSVDFDEIAKLQHEGEWNKIAEKMAEAAENLKKAGADFILFCTNTIHFVADMAMRDVGIPYLHIADAAGESMKRDGIKKAALLGTRFTMEMDFYKKRISDKYGIDVIIPEAEDIKIIHDIIYNELVMGVFSEESAGKYMQIIEKLIGAGAEGVILGCTEIPILLKNKSCRVTMYDTTEIHSDYAVAAALQA